MPLDEAKNMVWVFDIKINTDYLTIEFQTKKLKTQNRQNANFVVTGGTGGATTKFGDTSGDKVSFMTILLFSECFWKYRPSRVTKIFPGVSVMCGMRISVNNTYMMHFMKYVQMCIFTFYLCLYFCTS